MQELSYSGITEYNTGRSDVMVVAVEGELTLECGAGRGIREGQATQATNFLIKRS
jgi:hypothetical protein